MSRSDLIISQAAASRRLCLLATLKSDLGITDASEDTKLDRLIVAASLALSGADGLGRAPWYQTYLEHLPGPDGIYLFPTHWPIRSVDSITFGTGASPTTVTASDYSIRGDRRAIYKVTEWTRSGWAETPRGVGARALDYNVTYRAGWVMPDQATAWAASTAYAVGDWVSATDDDEPFIFECTVAGDSDATEPTWPTAPEGTVADNTATWTAYDQRLPQEVEEAALVTCAAWFKGEASIPAGLKRESVDGATREYFDRGGGDLPAIPPSAMALIRNYREAVAA